MVTATQMDNETETRTLPIEAFYPASLWEHRRLIKRNRQTEQYSTSEREENILPTPNIVIINQE